MDRKRQIRKLSKEANRLISEMIDNTPNLERKRALIKASVIMKSISILTADVIKRQINLK